MNNSTQDTRQWDEYWRTGRTSCCCDHDGSANAEIIRGLWTEFFDSLREGERLIDLCTGNGAVMNMALESARKNGLEITACGVDSASIAPTGISNQQPRADSYFVRASVTALPFEDCCVDAITSQFGIEYAPPEQVVAESLRILRSGGRGLFVTHARGGVTVTQARAELTDIDELQDEIRIFPAALEALPLLCAVERSSHHVPFNQLADARRAHEAFHERLARVGDNWQKRAALAVFRNTGAILQHTFQSRHDFPVEVLVNKVRETEQSVALHKDRLQTLVDAALEQKACEHFVSVCRRHAVTACEFSPVQAADGAGQLAWAITVHK
jgi:SAM-dependent methyltransferase